ncbi:exopolysaccharide biosynthesis polyprenyl glycosylphosphotransferase [Streptomyces ossamyceticus]|uniref:exopolysaccharide biosynthesis polyprenyl glycosylphosphotransferase n=1 Tax=Streptomyces ossamyceticus TaxID=249581 RepID=UPI0006E2694E|nr:exopolysaccharide biosynthesis polyprenyl glycosylphosphotransferase [Streptomyces ossamyceticus]
MTAHSTISSPATHPREHGSPPFSVMPSRGAVPSAPRPVGRPRPPGAASPVSLLVADGAAALLGALTLTGPQLHPPALALLAALVLLRPHRTRPPLPGVLDELPAICGRIAVAWLALAALTAAYRPEHALSARTLLVGFAVQAAASCALRGMVHTWCRSALLRNPGATLVIGPAATAQRVAAAVLRHPRCGLRPVGIVAEQQDGAGDLPVLTTREEVARAVVQNGVRAALAVDPSVRFQQGPLLSALADWGCTVWEVDADSPSYATKDRLAGFSCRLLQRSTTPLASAGKRAFDILVSATLLLLVSPLLLVCAVALRITDGPGVVFRQERIGKDGKPFTLLKFRTHRPLDEHEAATRWSVANEREMRGFCRMLRRTSLDELLQLWNVLRGDMSLVGPRPERPYFVGQFSESYPGYAARHRMRTGLTGLAQIHGLRGDTSIEDRFRFDNVYIDNWSLWQDVCILLRTVGTLTRPTGS